MSNNDKLGSVDKDVGLIINFLEAVMYCGLEDFGWKGYPFTWSSRIFRENMIKKRLDRFLVVRIGGA